VNAVREQHPGARFFEIPKAEIGLGSLPPFEYKILRRSFDYSVQLCQIMADGLKKPGEAEERTLWLNRASEFRALQRRFIKRGRRGVSA
jgi:hypothetical protein